MARYDLIPPAGEQLRCVKCRQPRSPAGIPDLLSRLAVVPSRDADAERNDHDAETRDGDKGTEQRLLLFASN